jgi:hypothetical protein
MAEPNTTIGTMLYPIVIRLGFLVANCTCYFGHWFSSIFTDFMSNKTFYLLMMAKTPTIENPI